MTRVRFSPDGSMLASAGDDGLVRLWDVAIVIKDPKSATPLTETDFGDEGTDPLAEEDAGLEPEEIDGVPIPPNNTGYGAEGTKFRRLIETGVRDDLDETLEFYRRELTNRGWEESSDETVVQDDEARLQFASDGAELTLQLKRTPRETKITLNLSRRGEAEKAGVLPQPGRARIIMGNSSGAEVTITINDETFKLAAGEGADKPDGPTVHLKPGKKAESEELELGADETWGLIVLPQGSLPLQIY